MTTATDPRPIDDAGGSGTIVVWRALTVLAVAFGLIGPGADRAAAQAQVRDFATQPILVLNPGGHTAPVRSLIFAGPDGDRLLSAGMDKVVHAWDLRDGRPSLARTIRPPIWRGYRGVIYAMALLPEVDGRGGLLALAGYGVENNGGNITLIRYPGGAGVPTGEVARQIPGGTADTPEVGHTDTVMALAFDPTGRDRLASAGKDGTVRLWDPRTGRALAWAVSHAGSINALAFAPDGRRLVSGGDDGVLRVWEVGAASLRLISQGPSSLPGRLLNDRAGDEILTLSIGPDGNWVALGRENGFLERRAVARPNVAVRLNPDDDRGPIEAVAFSRDGGRLAVSVVAHRNLPPDRPRVDCDVEIRAAADGRVLVPVATVSNLVYALAFGPGDRLLAYAGGDDQAVHLKDLNDPEKPIVALRGQGRSTWEVAFGADSRTVAYSRSRGDLPGAAPEFEGFDLKDRRPVEVDPKALQGPILSRDGWRVRPVDPWTLDVLNAQGQGTRIVLDRDQDRRWWSSSFLPPGPGHARLTLAIGCEGGVAIYVYDDARRQYVRSRYLSGHSGPVYALAPSPDGRWLATGSSDQSVRIWRLAGCDLPAPLGASIGPLGPVGLPVEAVEPLGFAEAMGLRKGDVIVEAFLNAKPIDLRLVAGRAESEPPGTKLEFLVRRGDERVAVGTTRRDAPSLNLFPGLDREWVAWMPEGYYDTSIVGDRKYLGWQRNRGDLTQPTDYFTADRFEAELRKPEVLARLWETADLGQALALLPNPNQDPSAIVEANRPPTVRITEPARPPGLPLVVQAAALSIRALASSEGARPIRSLRVLIDSQVGPGFDFGAAGQAEVDRRADLNLTPGLHRINVIATNDDDKERVESFDVLYEQPEARLPRLVVRAVGAGAFPSVEGLAIPFADRDAEKVGTFLSELGRPRAKQVDLAAPLVDTGATAEAIRAVLAGLDAELTEKTLAPGDTVILMLESHALNCDGGTFLVGSDAEPGPSLPPSNAIPAAEVSDALGRLADYGCRVMLLIDAVHPNAPESWNSGVAEWARALWHKNVIAFVASNSGPGERLGVRTRQGAFAQGILQSLDAPARSRLWANPDGPLTLGDFQEAVVQQVQDLTARRQFPNCYVPEIIPSQLPIFDPHPPDPAVLGAPVAIGGDK